MVWARKKTAYIFFVIVRFERLVRDWSRASAGDVSLSQVLVRVKVERAAKKHALHLHTHTRTPTDYQHSRAERGS